MIKKYIIFLCVFILLSCSRSDQIEQVEDPYLYKKGILEKGQTLAEALIKSDLNNVEVYKLVNKLDSIYNLRRSHPGDSFFVKLDTLGIIHELVYFPDVQYQYSVKKDTLDNYHTAIDTIRLIKEIKKCKGKIESSLYQAMIDQGEGSALPVMFTQIFQWDIDFFIDPQKDDLFELVYEQYHLNDHFVKYGDILVARYISRNYENTAFRYTNKKGKTHYYDDKGTSFQKAFLKSPLNYKRISSYFGYRKHPITKKVRLHNGVDYAAAYGTPVEASADGVVIHRGWKGGHPTVNGRSGGYGKTIMIRHTNGYKTLYGHLSSYGKFKVGDRVKQHDIIGYVGSTGLSTGNHLHYTIYQHDKAINPLKLKNVSGPPVPKDEMSLYLAIRDSLTMMLESDSLAGIVKSDLVSIEEYEASQHNAIEADHGEGNKAWRILFIILIILVILLISLRIIILLKRRKRYFY